MNESSSCGFPSSRSSVVRSSRKSAHRRSAPRPVTTLEVRRGSIDMPAATGAFAFASAVAVNHLSEHISELLMWPPFAA